MTAGTATSVHSRHLYHLLFAGEPTGGAVQTSIETLDVRWFPLAVILWTELSPGHEARIRQALAWRAGESTRPFFDREGWRPPA